MIHGKWSSPKVGDEGVFDGCFTIEHDVRGAPVDVTFTHFVTPAIRPTRWGRVVRFMTRFRAWVDRVRGVKPVSLREALCANSVKDPEEPIVVYKDWSFNGDYDADGRPAPTEIRFVCKNRIGPGIANLAGLHRLDLFNGDR